MTKQTFDGVVFNTAPAQSPPNQAAPTGHPLAPLPPTFHVRNNARVTNYYFITIAPQAGLAAQKQIAALPTVVDENWFVKLTKCLSCKP